MGWPAASYLCRVLFARAPVLGLYFVVAMNGLASRVDGLRHIRPHMTVWVAVGAL